MATSASLPPPGMGTLEMSDPPLVLDAASPAAKALSHISSSTSESVYLKNKSVSDSRQSDK
jgi:hypothetical protein